MKFWRFFEDTHHFLFTYFKIKYFVTCAAKLSIDLAIDELFSCIFHRENENFVNFFSNSKFRMRVHWSFLEAKPRIFFFLHIFEDISTKNQYFEKN
jgi:hypothetical protein